MTSLLRHSVSTASPGSALVDKSSVGAWELSSAMFCGAGCASLEPGSARFCEGAVLHGAVSYGALSCESLSHGSGENSHSSQISSRRRRQMTVGSPGRLHTDPAIPETRRVADATSIACTSC